MDVHYLVDPLMTSGDKTCLLAACWCLSIKHRGMGAPAPGILRSQRANIDSVDGLWTFSGRCSAAFIRFKLILPCLDFLYQCIDIVAIEYVRVVQYRRAHILLEQ